MATNTYRTRAPRSKPATFRMTDIIATTTSAAMRDAIHNLNPKWITSRVIRIALDAHADNARRIKVPEVFRPPVLYQARVNLSTTLREPGLRQRYDMLARGYGITMSELILRCLSKYVIENRGLVMGDAEENDPTNSCPTQDQIP